MTDATGRPDRIVVLGGSSLIARELVYALTDGRPCDVILAGRPHPGRDDAAEQLLSRGLRPHHVDLDVTATTTHDDVIAQCWAAGDVDVVIVAFGSLGDQQRLLDHPEEAVELAHVNYVGALSLGLRAVTRLRAQGHGRMIALSSVAGQVPRPANFIYGSTKAGLDAFFVGLGDVARPDGVRVHTVRAGFVKTPLTAHLSTPPLATSPQQLAARIVAGIRRDSTVIWAPPTMRWITAVLRALPRRIVANLKV